MQKASHFSRWVKQYYPLLIILLAAAIVRLVFFTDMVRNDDLRYAYAAYELSQGYFGFDGWVGNARIGLYGPVAIFYWLFGPNTITTLAFPFLSSLASVVLVHEIARMHAGKIAGMIAAFLWAFLPLDIFLATDLLADGPVATFSTASVYFFLLAERGTKPRQKYILFGLTIVTIVWAFLIKPIAVITFIYLLSHLLWNLWRRYKGWVLSIVQPLPRRIWITIFLVVLFALVLASVLYTQNQPQPLIVSLHLSYKDLIQQFINGVTDVDYVNQRFTQVDLLLPLGILFLVSVTYLLTSREATSKQPLAWLFILFFYYEWGSVFPNPLVYRPIEEIYEARNLLFLLAPLVIVISLYLARGIQQDTDDWIIPSAAILVMAFAWVFRGMINDGSLGPIFSFAVLASFFGPVISVNWIRGGANRASSFISISLLIALAVAMLKPAWPYHASYYQSQHETLNLIRGQVAFLDHLPSQPIYTDDPYFLDFASGFQLGYSWNQSNRVMSGPERVFNIPSDLNEVAEGIVITTSEIQLHPSNWDLLRNVEYEPNGSNLFIYQVSDHE